MGERGKERGGECDGRSRPQSDRVPSTSDLVPSVAGRLLAGLSAPLSVTQRTLAVSEALIAKTSRLPSRALVRIY